MNYQNKTSEHMEVHKSTPQDLTKRNKEEYSHMLAATVQPTRRDNYPMPKRNQSQRSQCLPIYN